MIKLCPKCGSERPVVDVVCTNTAEGVFCGWDLTDVPIMATSPAQAAPPVRRCSCGQTLAPGDLICLECGEELADEESVQESPALDAQREALTGSALVIAGWRVLDELEGQNHVQERYIAERDGVRGVLTLYHEAYEPDTQVFEVLGKMDPDHVPLLLEMGRFDGQAYVVSELLDGGSLADFRLEPEDMDSIRRIVDEVGRALESFTQVGLRHRDLRPSNIRIRSHDPLDLVITGFGSARLSELDLDIVSPLETSRYMAPEAVMGGVSAASDWWSLGMILLELLTQGSCFGGAGDQLFLIHVLANGVRVPDNVDPTVTPLLRGLLAKERTQRWSHKEVQAWLNGETVAPPPAATEVETTTTGPSLSLGGQPISGLRRFALAASTASNWEEALALLEQGRLATWAEEVGLQGQPLSALRLMSTRTDLTGDFRLGVALKLLNPALPLIQREEIVSPGWLVEHPDVGYDLVTGPFPEVIKKLGFDTEDWLLGLARRAQTVRQRADTLEIEIQKEVYRALVLTTSRARLVAEWEERRKWFPDTEHPGIASLLDRPNLADEDLLLLCVAAPHQFRAREQILERARELAQSLQLDDTTSPPGDTLSRSRREIFADVDRLIEGFARCGNDTLDQWADQFRLTRRLELEKAAVLLSLPPQAWVKPQYQEYVARILQFFEKKVAGAVLRGPLVRMVLGKTTPRIDLTEVSEQPGPLLDKLILRSEQIIPLNPEVFAGANNPENRIRSLVSRTVTYQRDTGINGLYLGFPFLLRRDKPGKSTRPRLAPILLWPIKVKAEVGSRGHISVAFDRERDEVRLNPAFEGMLGIEGAARWRDVAKELLENQSLRPVDVLDALGVLARVQSRELRPLPAKEADVEHLKDEVVPAAVLFHVEFLGQAIVEDLRQLQSVPPAGTALERMLRLGERPNEVGPSDTTQTFLITHSDPSQERAIGQAWQPPGLLVQGPPGTGKSQTIVNLVGDAIGRHRSILIVCQKLPALEVVKKRLVAEGLGERLVMVTDVNKDRQPVIRALREQLDRFFGEGTNTGQTTIHQRERLCKQIINVEAEIDRHHQAIYKVDQLSGQSYREILSNLLALENHARKAINVPALRRLFQDVAPSTIDAIEEACGSLAAEWLPAAFENSPLHVLKPFSADPAIVDEFGSAFESYVKADQERRASLATTMAGPEVQDPSPLALWLQHHEPRLNGLSQTSRDRLQLWLDAFLVSGKGPVYRQIIEGLVLLQSEQQRPWIEVPQIRDLEPVECGALAQLWLAARYEGSALHCLASFTVEPETAGLLQNLLEGFMEAERQRDKAIADTAPGLETENAGVLERWLHLNESTLQGLDEQQKLNLTKWLPLFRGERQGLVLRASLETQLALLESMDPTHHHDELFPFFSALTPLELLEWAERGARASARPKSFFSKLSLRRAIARSKVAGQLKKLGEPPTETRLLDFAQAAALEQELRKIVKALKPALEALGRSQEATSLPFLKNATRAVLAELLHVQDFAARLSACPFVAEAERAATAGALSSQLPLMRAAAQRCRCRQASRAALDSLRPYFGPTWIAEREEAIAAAQSSHEASSPILAALPSLAAFQDFRSRVQPAQAKVFNMLATRREDFEKVPAAELGAEVQRTILREKLLKERLLLEGEEPSLRPQADDLELLQSLKEVEELTGAVKHLPYPATPLIAALRKADANALRNPFSEMKGAVDRCRSRQASIGMLSALGPWIDSNWIEERRREVESGQRSHWESLREALPTVAAFQLFRQRSQTLPAPVLEVFRCLAEHRPALQQIPQDELGSEVKRYIRREASLGWKSRLERAEPLLQANRQELATRVQSLAECDLKLRERNREHLATYIETDRIVPRRQWDDLLMLTGARARRLREVLTRGPEFGLLALRPVWLMNPEVASQLLPCSRALFDLVIYDEASQMPVEYALPTLYRAQNIVVSGDDKQMPPTSFFASKVESDEAEAFDGELPDEGTTEEEREVMEETWNRREIKDCPDLLHLAKAALPQVTLQIHYRSDYRQLISFSNAAFYNSALSVPVRHPADEVRRIKPIEFVAVNGIYEEQTNRLEAQRVVEYLGRVWKLSPRPSTGVVTFNRKQADLILRYLEEAAEKDAVFRAAYSQELERQDNGEDMATFVKNVENVQGDERDIIVFSTTFGKNRQGAFRRNFGVLGQKGGERRLNVAVTRARKKIAIVSSIPIQDISDMLSTRRTVSTPRDYLQAYLEYARLLSNGDLDEADLLRQRITGDNRQRVTSVAQRDGLAQSVETFLLQLGHEPHYTGDDPALGIDFALVNPKTKQFAIGIECEAPRHPLLTRARAREIWRPGLLAKAYKKVHRVSAHGWYHDCEKEKSKLRAAIAAALPSEVLLERS